jgi:hypothetical protein
VGGQDLADRAAVVGRLVGEGLGREQVDRVDHQQQPVGELQVQVPGAGCRRQVVDRLGAAGSRTSMTVTPLLNMWPT